MSKINLTLKVNNKKIVDTEWESDLSYKQELDAHWFATAV